MNTSVFKQYGKLIIEVVVILAILGILAAIKINGKTGISNVLGTQAEIEDVDYEAFEDAVALRNYTSLGTPEIVYTNARVRPGTEMDLNREFSAEGTDGTPAKIKILDVKDESGKSLVFASEEDKRKDNRMADTSSFEFPKQGIYTVSVKAADANNRISYMNCNIPVTH